MWIRGLIGLLMLGALFHLLFRGAGHRALETLVRAPWQSLGLGFLLTFAVPCASAFLLVLGIIFGGWWIAPGILVLFLFALAMGYVVGATEVGRLLLRRSALVWAFVLGLFVLGLVSAIPFVGWLVGFAAALFGLGALAIAWYESRWKRPVPAAT
jgi:hypothetical protein